jgi:Baseplate J-like protein
MSDRLQILRNSTTLNGIDFVEISSPDQKTLIVRFINKVELDATTVTDIAITGGETISTVKISNSSWAKDLEDFPILTIIVEQPGDFSRYTLRLKSDRLDRFFTEISFSFKALCESTLDCAPKPVDCPSLPDDKPPIDYLAKDFLSFRQVLSDFSALRYPEWRERSEADFGVMLMEALCAVADDLSYTQDRIAAEATLETATQRRSIVSHARLVDYEPKPATAARVWLQLDVNSDPIPAGLVVSAQSPDGATIYFETGTGLVDRATGRMSVQTYLVDRRWNRNSGMKPYYWDDSQRCLLAGSTSMWIENVSGQPFGFPSDEELKKQDIRLLIETPAAISADPPIRELVRLIKTEIVEDRLFNKMLTHLTWSSEDALKFDRDLTKTTLAGNLVPATQGRRFTETFAIDAAPASNPQTPLAISRLGTAKIAEKTLHSPSMPESSTEIDRYLYTLNNAPLVWLDRADPELAPLPEIVLTAQKTSDLAPWIWRRSLLKAEEFEAAFTIDPVRYSLIDRLSDGSFAYDYDGDDGDTIRFGDGTFGEIPTSETVFQVIYRSGGGSIGNVAADSITGIDPAATTLITSVTNPFPATGGADAEPNERVRRLAPQAFRAKQFRAVRPEDYQAAAQSLPWVQRAGTVFRWTGSWLTVFTTPDPKNSEVMKVEQHTQLINLLNRYRLAGYESYVPIPRYVSLDLQIRACAKPDVFRGDVEAAMLSVLSDDRLPDGNMGFFNPDRWSFGLPLERSALESAIQSAYGVAGVVSIRYRQRGTIPDYIDLPDIVLLPVDAILRVDNDPNHPERGALKIFVEGGK